MKQAAGNKIKPFVDDGQKKGFEIGPVYYYEAKAGAILADHAHDMAETLWVMNGRGQIIIGESMINFEAPCEIQIPANIYHKFMPITDVKFIELRHETKTDHFISE